MKRSDWSNWYDVLEPREAVMAGIVGVGVVWLLGYYAFQAGFDFWGYSPAQWKNPATAIALLGFAVPYWLVKWLMQRR